MDEFEAIFGASNRAPREEQQGAGADDERSQPIEGQDGPADGAADGADADLAPPSDAAQGEPAKRESWQVRAAREEERRLVAERERDELRAKAAEAAKPKAEAKEEPRPLPRPDPITDPDGFAAYLEHQTTKRILDGFEEDLRESKGTAEVDAKLALFEAAVKADPALGPRVMAAKNPWRAMFKEAELFAKRQEIGDDPDAFRTKVEAEIRAKVEAEMKAANSGAQQQAPGGVEDDRGARAAAALDKIPASLAGARNSAPRAAGAYSGPKPLDMLLPA